MHENNVEKKKYSEPQMDLHTEKAKVLGCVPLSLRFHAHFHIFFFIRILLAVFLYDIAYMAV